MDATILMEYQSLSSILFVIVPLVVSSTSGRILLEDQRFCRSNLLWNFIGPLISISQMKVQKIIDECLFRIFMKVCDDL